MVELFSVIFSVIIVIVSIGKGRDDGYQCDMLPSGVFFVED